MREAQRIGHIGHWHWTIEDDRFVASEEVYRIYGFGRGTNLSFQSVIDATHEEDALAARKNRDAALREKRSYDFAYRIKRPDGEVRSVEGRAEPVLDKDGKLVSFAGVVHDVTERKRMEERRQESETQLRNILECSPIGVAVTSHSLKDDCIIARRLFNNMALAKLFGFESPEEAIEADVSDSWVDRKQLQKANATLSSGSELIDFEALLRRKDGSEFWVSMNTRPIQFNGQDATMAWHFDITERKRAEEALRASEARFSGILDIAPEAIISIDEEQRINLFNQGAVQIFGYAAETVIGKPLDILLPERFRGKHVKYLSDFSKTGNVSQLMRQRGVVTGLKSDGTEFPAEASITKLEMGEETVYTVILRDITERKRVADKLKSSEKLLEKTFDSMIDALLVVDPATRTIVKLNQAASDIFGYPRAELLGKKTELLYPSKADYEEAGRLFFEAMDHTGEFEYEPVMRRADGSTFMANQVSREIRDDNDRSILSISVIRDVTERKKAENAQRESDARFRSFFENVPLAVMFKNLDGHYSYMNQHFIEWFGVSVEKQQTLTVANLTSPKVAAESLAVDQEVLKNGEVIVRETMRQFADGEWHPVRISKFPINDSDGNPKWIGVIHDDLSERRKTEAQLHQAQKMEAIGQLTGGMAHDFNNLLGIIIGNLDFLAEELDDNTELLSFLEPAMKAALSGADLNRQLLAYSRKQTLLPKLINLGEQVSGMLGMLRRTLGETIEIVEKWNHGTWFVEVDPAQVESALLNLAVNARHAMPEGGKLTIETMKVIFDDDYVSKHPYVSPGEYVMLTVTDTGTGMSPEVQAQVFEPFFTTKGVGEGSGLGLSMVFGFTKQSGGHVEIESEEGQGTTVKLCLPHVRRKEKAAPAKKEEIQKARGETVLVVEDNPELLKLAINLLHSLDYEVLDATDGRSALAMMEGTSTIDLLLTDVVMPGAMNGPALVKETALRYPEIKALYMSGCAQDMMKNETLLDIDAPILQKPFRKPELAHMVRTVLDV